MQRLNTWLGKLLPLMDSRSRTAGAVPVWNAVNGNWEPSNAVQALQTELEALKSRVAALEQRRKSRLPPRIKPFLRDQERPLPYERKVSEGRKERSGGEAGQFTPWRNYFSRQAFTAPRAASKSTSWVTSLTICS